jgi:hypothetical protein
MNFHPVLIRPKPFGGFEGNAVLFFIPFRVNTPKLASAL